MLSLIEIISIAACSTVSAVPSGSFWRSPLPATLMPAVTVTVWFQLTRWVRTALASAPSTKSLNIDPSGRGVAAEIALTERQAPPGSTLAARKLT